MSFTPLGPPPVDTALIVSNNAIKFSSSLRHSGWFNLVHQILERVVPFVSNNAFMISLDQLPVYANNAAAIAGGLGAGNLYRSGSDPDVLSVVH